MIITVAQWNLITDDRCGNQNQKTLLIMYRKLFCIRVALKIIRKIENKKNKSM